jgi:hypothetical protein
MCVCMHAYVCAPPPDTHTHYGIRCARGSDLHMPTQHLFKEHMLVFQEHILKWHLFKEGSYTWQTHTCTHTHMLTWHQFKDGSSKAR